MKKEYESAKIEIVVLDGKDILTDSPVTCPARMKDEEEFD